ncbi:MAG: pyruvate kinase [Phycisphaerales bacterium]
MPNHPNAATIVAPPRASLTKILATLGPASEEPKVLARMVDAGARLFRLNFSHGDFDSHLKRLEVVRAVARQTGIPLAVLGDLQGPKIRVGVMPEAGVTVEPGDEVIVSAAATSLELRGAGEKGQLVVLPTTYPQMVREVAPGQRVLINDGAVRMFAVESINDELRCVVNVGGKITSKKGINLPDSTLGVPALSARDWECALWALEHDLDFLALSFVRKGADVADLNRRLSAARSSPHDSIREPGIPVIAKIETPQGVANIDEILQHAAGIMVARGDLGVEMDLAQVPVVQKRLVARAHDFGKPCIVATQMLESMIESQSATRAEVSDVANAILDGADAVMLSGETAVGKWPVLAVDTMRRVALATEEAVRQMPWAARPPVMLQNRRDVVAALAHGAWVMARDIGAEVIAVWTQTGGTAQHLSRNGFRCPILAFSSDERSVRRMNLLAGVMPHLRMELPKHRFEFAMIVEQIVLAEGWAEPGDRMVLLAGVPFDRPGGANTVALRVVGDITAAGLSPDG